MKNLLTLLCIIACVPMACGQPAKGKKKIKEETHAAPVDYKKIGAPLPPLHIYTRDGLHLTEKDLAGDGYLILMLFNPTCDHCEEQTRLFKEHLSAFKKTRLALLAAGSMVPHLGYFSQITQTADVPELIIGVDSADYIDQTFQQVTLPQINVYNSERKLVDVFLGSTPLDSLQKYIE